MDCLLRPLLLATLCAVPSMVHAATTFEGLQQIRFEANGGQDSTKTKLVARGPGFEARFQYPAFLTGTGNLLIVPLVNTTPTNITATVSGNVLTLSWPADHLGWKLQIQTNSLATGLNTNWVTLPGSDAVISTNFTINPANDAVFYRMVYP